MSVTVKIAPIEEDIEVILNRDLSPAARSHAFAEYAREVLAGAEEQNARALGHVPLHETFVDGRHGVAEDAVRPDGVIVYEFEILEDLTEWIGEQLVLNSPVGHAPDRHPGLYAASHRLIVDGAELMKGMPLPRGFGEAVFLNIQPYARRIERGSSLQAPDGVYQGVAALAARRFGNVARVRFTYRALVEGGRAPAIVITPR